MFRFSEKALKIWKKISYLFLRYQVNVQEKWIIVTIFWVFLEYLNFEWKKSNCRKFWLRSYKVEEQTWIVFLALWWRLLSKAFTNTQSLVLQGMIPLKVNN